MRVDTLGPGTPQSFCPKLQEVMVYVCLCDVSLTTQLGHLTMQLFQLLYKYDYRHVYHFQQLYDWFELNYLVSTIKK